MTREEYLGKCIDLLRPDFDRAGFSLPEKIRVSCGWPSRSGLAEKKRRIGECWSAECSESQHFEIFISPFLRDPIEVLATLVHEGCHAAVGLEAGHKGPFRKCAKAIGLEGKMTATQAGEELKARLAEIIAEVGEYPHAKLDKGNGPKKQSTRMLKVVCLACGCVVRMTQKWLQEVGPPTCGCGGEMEVEEAESEGIAA